MKAFPVHGPSTPILPAGPSHPATPACKSERPMQNVTHDPKTSALPAGRRLLATIAALLALVLVPAGAAHADIIDFDPANDPVPEILDAEEMAKIQALSNSDWVYFFAPPNASGSHAYAYVAGATGILDLSDGSLAPLPDDLPGMRNVPDSLASRQVSSGWMDPQTLGFVMLQLAFGEDGAVTSATHHLVAIKAATMAAESTPLPWLDDLQGGLVGFSPDLSMALVMQAPDGGPLTADSRTVTLGAPEFRLPGDLPEGLPGVVGESVLGTMEVQQEAFVLAVVDQDGGNPRKLDASFDAETGLAGISWDLGGGRVALTSRTMPGWDGDRQRNNDPPGSGLPNLGSLPVREALGLIAPDDNPLVTGTHIQVFDAGDGSLAARFDNTDYRQGLLSDISFSPSGANAVLILALRSDLDGRDHPTYDYPRGLELHQLDAELKMVKKLSIPGADSLSTSLGWAGDGSLAAVVPDELDSQVVGYDLASGMSLTLWDRPGSIVQAFAGADWAAMTWQSVNAPMELYRVTGATPERITSVNAAAAEASDLRTETVNWTSSKGQAMEGIYIHHAGQAYPPAEPGPVVVWQQGGPGGQMTNDFGASVESPYSMLPNFGIPVFVANAAGRSVKSPQFFGDMAEGTNFGQLDIAQIKEGVDHLVAEGVVDADRVGITGCSYGGYFALQSIRTYPDYYAAANPQCSLVDLFEEFTFGYTPFISYLMGRSPMAEPMEYMQDSPMYGTVDVKTPTLIFHGMEDFLPVPLINNIHDQLEANGTPVTFLRVAEEGHGFGYPSSQAYAAQLQLEFFRDRLGVDKFEPPVMRSIYLPILGMRWVDDPS